MQCTYEKEKKRWFNPPQFKGISDEQLADLQGFIDTCGLDAKTVCEHLGLDALNQIEASKFEAVKNDIEQLAKGAMTA